MKAKNVKSVCMNNQPKEDDMTNFTTPNVSQQLAKFSIADAAKKITSIAAAVGGTDEDHQE